MPVFPSKPFRTPSLNNALRRHPALFGVPFILIIVGASFGLQTLTQTRYDLHNQKVTQVRGVRLPWLKQPEAQTNALRVLKVTKEEALGLDKNKRNFDIREEYYVSSLDHETFLSSFLIRCLLAIECSCGEGLGAQKNSETRRSA